MSGWRVIVIEGFSREKRREGEERDVLYFREFLRLGVWRKLGGVAVLLGEFTAGVVLPAGLAQLLMVVIGGVVAAAGGRPVVIAEYVVGGVIALSAAFLVLAGWATVHDARYRVVHFEYLLVMLGASIGIAGLLLFV